MGSRISPPPAAADAGRRGIGAPEIVTSEPVRGEGDAHLKVAEIDRLRIHNLVLRQQICREQLNVLMLQFLQTTAPKAAQAGLDAVTQQVTASVERLFADAKLDPQRYQFNVDAGVFVERPARS